MIYNEYGKTGLKVLAIGMGGMRFANQDNHEVCALLVKAAYDSGINYFDSVPGYGKSEKQALGAIAHHRCFNSAIFPGQQAGLQKNIGIVFQQGPGEPIRITDFDVA